MSDSCWVSILCTKDHLCLAVEGVYIVNKGAYVSDSWGCPYCIVSNTCVWQLLGVSSVYQGWNTEFFIPDLNTWTCPLSHPLLEHLCIFQAENLEEFFHLNAYDTNAIKGDKMKVLAYINRINNKITSDEQSSEVILNLYVYS